MSYRLLKMMIATFNTALADALKTFGWVWTALTYWVLIMSILIIG